MTIFYDVQSEKKSVSFINFVPYRNELLKVRYDAQSIMQALAHLNFKIIKNLCGRFITSGRECGHDIL